MLPVLATHFFQDKWVKYCGWQCERQCCDPEGWVMSNLPHHQSVEHCLWPCRHCWSCESYKLIKNAISWERTTILTVDRNGNLETDLKGKWFHFKVPQSQHSIYVQCDSFWWTLCLWKWWDVRISGGRETVYQPPLSSQRLYRAVPTGNRWEWETVSWLHFSSKQ